MAQVNFQEINQFLNDKKLSPAQALTVALGQLRKAARMFGAYNSPIASFTFKVQEDLELAVLANKFYMANRNTKTYTQDEVLEGGRQLARDNAQKALDKEQLLANQGRPEMTYKTETNSADYGRVDATK